MTKKIKKQEQIIVNDQTNNKIAFNWNMYHEDNDHNITKYYHNMHNIAIIGITIIIIGIIMIIILQ